MKVEYHYNSDQIKSDLSMNGFARLPSILDQVTELNTYENYMDECGETTYSENSHAQINLISELNLQPLFDELYRSASIFTKKKLRKGDTYYISRYVSPNQVSEGYRGHFDSHLFTLVLPIKIPKILKKNSGQLLAIPKARKQPNSEMKNIFDKIIWKRHCSEIGFDRLEKRSGGQEISFEDYRPYIFIGNTTFHGNRPLEASDSARLSMLCHLFDPNPRYGVGALLRAIRNR